MIADPSGRSQTQALFPGGRFGGGQAASGAASDTPAFNLQVLAENGVGASVTAARGLYASRCDRCHVLALWFDDRLIWPRTGAAPAADDDLPDVGRNLYEKECMSLCTLHASRACRWFRLR